jgi:hypothetical protein
VEKEGNVQISLGVLLAVVALIAGILMAVGGRWSGYPLAAIAIICLALIQLLPAVGIAR